MHKNNTLKFMIHKLQADVSPGGQSYASDSLTSSSKCGKIVPKGFKNAVARYLPPSEQSFLRNSGENQAQGKVKYQANIKKKLSKSWTNEMFEELNSLMDLRKNSFEENKKPLKNDCEIYFTGKIMVMGDDLCSRKLTENSLVEINEDEKGYFKGFHGDHIAFRYEILESLGKGTFGEVFKCLDHKTNKFVAIKVVRNVKEQSKLAQEELEILEELGKNAQGGDEFIVQMIDHFEFCGHLCIAFELLGMSLLQVLENNNYQGLPIETVKILIKQLLTALKTLHTMHIIHCDLKPNNILLKEKNKGQIKLIDFGSACIESKKVQEYLQNLYYRAPEIVLDIDYGKSIDIWSLGCITAELLTGQVLFFAQNDHELFKMMVETCGLPDRNYIRKGRRINLFVDRQGKLKLKTVPNSKTVNKILQDYDDDTRNFVESCLKWQPEQRLTVDQALAHPWISSVDVNECENIALF
ncbi:hypothetical protein SteCoe_13800 [Stentor coeruleus]|uniref:Protein kinase domain-containing protein n=1 Tax=Stentor coeruleus TaxID=5963 RepID=A0A1R2C7H8_9CILI|nr:hypothetical protein SteCoe_13800 [Stentor coeruleus]